MAENAIMKAEPPKRILRGLFVCRKDWGKQGFSYLDGTLAFEIVFFYLIDIDR